MKEDKRTKACEMPQGGSRSPDGDRTPSKRSKGPAQAHTEGRRRDVLAGAAASTGAALREKKPFFLPATEGMLSRGGRWQGFRSVSDERERED